jgi:hypothetical protein
VLGTLLPDGEGPQRGGHFEQAGSLVYDESGCELKGV